MVGFKELRANKVLYKGTYIGYCVILLMSILRLYYFKKSIKKIEKDIVFGLLRRIIPILECPFLLTLCVKAKNNTSALK